MKRYATKKEVTNLAKAVNELARATNDMSKWMCYINYKSSDVEITEDLKKQVLEHAKGHVTYVLFKRLFERKPTPTVPPEKFLRQASQFEALGKILKATAKTDAEKASVELCGTMVDVCEMLADYWSKREA